MLVLGNTPTNAPYEARFVERLVEWWRARRGGALLAALPAPSARRATGRSGSRPRSRARACTCRSRATRTSRRLATLLQHADCVVANAGTILLDSLVNDRPAVCVLYDEGAPPGERWAELNVAGEHYRELVRSGAFYRASGFEEVAAGIERALAHPDELADERRRVAREVVGEVDGRAAERVVEAIVATAPDARPRSHVVRNACSAARWRSILEIFDARLLGSSPPGGRLVDLGCDDGARTLRFAAAARRRTRCTASSSPHVSEAAVLRGIDRRGGRS